MLLELWLITAGMSLVSYYGAALLVDGRVDMGTWERYGLLVAMLTGPLGTAITLYFVVTQLWMLRHEGWLLPQVFRGSLMRIRRKAKVYTRRLVLRLGGKLYLPSEQGC